MSINVVISVNINRLYVAQIYVNYHYKILDDLTIDRKGKFVKNAVVYHDEFNRYIDLISGESYKLGIYDTYLGNMYIYLDNGLIPINRIYDVKFDRCNMSRKRIIRTLSKSKLLNKKEDDK